MKKIFIVGPPRSGTTLCQALIVASEKVLSFPESHFLETLPREKGILRSMRFMQSWFRLWRWGIRRNHKRPSKLFFSRRSAILAFVDYLTSIASENGFDGWVEKTPVHLHYVKELKACVPDASFIFTARQAPSNIASLERSLPLWSKRSDESDFSAAVARWASDTLLVYLRSLEVRGWIVDYDGLLENTASEIKALYNYLSLGEPIVENLNRLDRITEPLVDPEEGWKENNLSRSSVGLVSSSRLCPDNFESMQSAFKFLERKSRSSAKLENS